MDDKDYITRKEETEHRHAFRNELQLRLLQLEEKISGLEKAIRNPELHNQICPFKTEISLTHQGLTVLNEKMDKIDSKLDKFIEAAYEKFATKERVIDLEKELSWYKRMLITSIISPLIVGILVAAFVAWLAK